MSTRGRLVTGLLLVAALPTAAPKPLTQAEACEGRDPVPRSWADSTTGATASPLWPSEQHYSFTRVLDGPKLAICSLPGCGSTSFRHFVNVLSNLTSTDERCLTVFRRGFAEKTLNAHLSMEKAPQVQPGCMRGLEGMSLEEVRVIACSGEWRRLAVVRNPFARVYSKFREKIVMKHEKRPPWREGDDRNFSTFVGRLAMAALEPAHLGLGEEAFVDDHWRRGVAFCGLRHIPYTILRDEELGAAMHGLAESLGLEGHPAVREVLARVRPHDYAGEAARLAEAYTQREVELVRLYYSEDFRAFGYPAEFPPRAPLAR